MTSKMLIAGSLVVALAACGKSGQQAGNQSAAATPPGGSVAAAQMTLNPGLWETTSEVAMSGVPANVAAMMKGAKVTARSCISQAQSSRPSGEIFAGKKREGCSYSNYSVSGGSVHGEVSCKAQDGHGAMTMVMDGKYGGDSFDVTMKVNTGAGGQNMAFGSHTIGRRIGDCPADMKKD